MKTREERLAYARSWNASYLESEKYEQRKAEARAKTAAYRQSDEYRQHLEKRRLEKLALKRERDRRYRERMTQERKAELVLVKRTWRQRNKPRVRTYLVQRADRRAEQKRTKRAAMVDWYIKEQLGLRNPPHALIEAKRLQLRIKRLLEDTNEQHRETA